MPVVYGYLSGRANTDACGVWERWFGLFGAGASRCGVSEHFSSSRRPSICSPLAGHSVSPFERECQPLAYTFEMPLGYGNGGLVYLVLVRAVVVFPSIFPSVRSVL